MSKQFYGSSKFEIQKRKPETSFFVAYQNPQNELTNTSQNPNRGLIVL